MAVDRVQDGDLELVDPRSLVPHAENPRRHDEAGIRGSIEEHGVIDVCVVQRSRRRILSGHGRWEQAIEAGASRVPVLWVDCDDDEADEILLVLNRTADRSPGYEPGRLAALLSRIRDSGRPFERATGWGAEDLRRFVARTRLKAGETLAASEDEGASVTRPSDPRSRPGDLWLLGEHRLLCGDARSADDVGLVLGGALADLLWTDPPYGVSYVGGSGLTLEGDDSTDVAVAALPVAVAALRPGGCAWVCSPSGPGLVDFARVLVELGVYHQQLVWVKDRFVLGRSDFHARHEAILFGAQPAEPFVPLLYGWAPGEAHEFLGDRTFDTVLEFPRPARSVEHPTMKPVALVGRALELNTYEGDVVLDPFVGSGTVIVACEQMRRRARALEVDPGYCDVAVRRWEQLTGLEAQLVREEVPV